MPEFVLVHVARTLQPPLLEAQLSVPAHIDNIHIALLSASTVALLNLLYLSVFCPGTEILRVGRAVFQT